MSLAIAAAVAPPDLAQRAVGGEPVQAEPDSDQSHPGSHSSLRAEGKKDAPAEDAERCDDQGGDNGPDICAQWVAANAARETAAISRDTLNWTIAAFFALALTLAATAWSAWASTVAASAAAKSAKLTEEAAELSAINAKRQIRSYLVITGVRFRYNQSPPDISAKLGELDAHPFALDTEIIVENVGQTPARRVRINIYDNFASVRGSNQWGTTSSNFYIDSLGKKRTVFKVFPVPYWIWGLDVINEIEVEIAGSMKWTDVFDDQHESEFIFSYDPRSIGSWPPVYEKVPLLEWVAMKEKAARQPKGPGR